MAKSKQKRLTNEMRGEIQRSIIFNTVHKKSESLTNEMRDVGDKIYSLCMDEYAEEISKLPAGFLPVSDRIGILCLIKDPLVLEPKLHFEYTAIHNPEGKSIGFSKSFKKNGYSIVPADSVSGRDPFVISEENGLVSEYMRLEKEWQSVTGSEYSTTRQVKVALEKFSTVNALVDQWPEIVEYIPKSILNDEKVFAIAVRLEDVNALIGKFK